MKNIETLTLVITNHNCPKIILPIIDPIITQPNYNIDMNAFVINNILIKLFA
ncbi:MAG: hypothetical protein LBG21_05415 [Campylobacteraceae bacterium]|nr:hypothetical protein [Campylobacteraceae bacterium]